MKLGGLDIFLICLGVYILIHCIFSVVIPVIVNIQTQYEFNKQVKNEVDEVFNKLKDFNDELMGFRCDLHIATSNYKDIEDRKQAAMRLSDSIIRFILEPSIKKE
ncbi:MAG: hypothetical protein IJ094_12960 [Bacilli bacterium]|nr:hypothetical protein [Bacilli bacterium]